LSISTTRWLPLADEAATLDFGTRLARTLPVQPAPLVLYLHGELGARKTTLARGILQALGEAGPVRSPTYSLVAEYQPAGQRVLHLDLYRLAQASELDFLGIADLQDATTLLLVEWPDHGIGHLPTPDLCIRFFHSGESRELEFQPKTDSGIKFCEKSAEYISSLIK
jgi:tRNA threonylcarbamoyladenosine biosynthesis protein TsaE